MRFEIRLSAVVMLPLVAVLSACAPSGGADPGSVTGIPETWLAATEEGWPSSPAYGGDVPVLSREKCLLGDTVPPLPDGGAEFTDTGWGAYGGRPEGYRYLCGLWKPDAYSGQLQLMRASSAADAQRTVEEFRTQQSTSEQENSVEEVTSGELDVLVLTRWYPTNPQGLYQALYFDEEQNALVSLEINSLGEEEFADLTAQEVADVLVETMAASS
ncbi:hypothetical protein [Microbacterium tumbae]